jgi:hypothetical protein
MLRVVQGIQYKHFSPAILMFEKADATTKRRFSLRMRPYTHPRRKKSSMCNILITKGLPSFCMGWRRIGSDSANP